MMLGAGPIPTPVIDTITLGDDHIQLPRWAAVGPLPHLGTTNRGDPFAYPMPDGSLKDRSEEKIEGVRLLGLDALIGIGGDGSLAILRRLAQQGSIPVVGIPTTIDNDVH